MISSSVSKTLIEEWKQTITTIDAMIAVGNCLKDRAASGAIGYIDDVICSLIEQRKALDSMIEDEQILNYEKVSNEHELLKETYSRTRKPN